MHCCLMHTTADVIQLLESIIVLTTSCIHYQHSYKVAISTKKLIQLCKGSCRGSSLLLTDLQLTSI